MAVRRAIGAGIGAGLSSLGDTLQQIALKKWENDLLLKRQESLSQSNQLQTLFDQAAKDPNLARRLAANPEMSARAKAAGFDFGALQPTTQDLQQPISKDINSAATPEQLPTGEDVVNQIRSGGGQITDDPSKLTGNQTGVSTADFIRQLQARKAKDASLTQAELDKPLNIKGVNKEGQTTETATTVGAARKLGEVPTSLSNAQNAARMGQAAGAEASARSPYEKPEVAYDENGKLVALKFKPDGKGNTVAEKVVLPEGLTKTAPKPLSDQEKGNMAALNTAEIYGVKVLQTLKARGLDRSNDPIDPRLNKWMVTEMGIAPADFDKAEVQQRTAFINALLTRNLMGARPAQYVAQLIQAHLPQGKMTGAQLFNTINRVLEEGSTRRAETGNTYGAKVPGPSSGMSYETWLQTQGGNANSNTPPPLSPGLDSILKR